MTVRRRSGAPERPKRKLPGYVLGGLALVVAGAFATALLILPIKAWMNQRHALKSSRATLEALDRSNADLQADVDRLKTRAGITQAAREELGVVAKREKAFRVLSLPKLDAVFPEDWLYPALKTLMIERVATVGGPAAPVEPGDPVLGADAATSPAASTSP